jgi:hypothetical protein
MNGFRNLTIAVLAASLGVAGSGRVGRFGCGRLGPAQAERRVVAKPRLTQAADGCAVLPRSGYR